MVSAVIFDLGSTLVDWPNWEEALERFGEGFVSDMFERSGLMYMLVDVPPGDQTQPETLLVMLAWEFAEGLRGR